MQPPNQKRQAPRAGGASVEAKHVGDSESTPEPANRLDVHSDGLVARWRLLGTACCDPRLSRTDIAVLFVIVDRMDAKTGTSWPGLGTVATDARMSRSSAVRAVRDLVQHGYLQRDSGGPGTSNRYRLGRVELAPRLNPAPRSKLAPGVGANLTLGVGAGLRPELAPLNQSHESVPRKTRAKKRAVFELPDWIPVESWNAWKRHRGTKLSAEAQRLGVKKLDQLRADGHDPAALIELAIESGWSRFFAPRPEHGGRPARESAAGRAERIGNQHLARIEAREANPPEHLSAVEKLEWFNARNRDGRVSP